MIIELRHAMTQTTEWLIHTLDFIYSISFIAWWDNFPSVVSHQILLLFSFRFVYILFYLLFKTLSLLIQILLRVLKCVVAGEKILNCTGPYFKLIT